MKKVNYYIENNIEKLLNGKETDFLLPFEVKLIKSKLNKKSFKTYSPYPEADKVILYVNKIPKISLFKIECSNSLRHQDILGSLFNQGISNNSFGDIIVENNNYYFYLLSKLDDFVINNLHKISKYDVSLNKIDVDYLKDFHKKYETNKVIVPSLRLDALISSIIKKSRKEINELINNKEVAINYETITKKTYIIKEDDIFSIHKYGKYKFIKVEKRLRKIN